MTGVLRIERLPVRRVAVVDHHGPETSVEGTRRPLYQHMVTEELVGGPSMIRFPDQDGPLELLVQTHHDFHGDHVCRVEELPQGDYAVMDWEGPPEELPDARERFDQALRVAQRTRVGPILQVHHMDPVDGVVEEQFQARLS